MSVILRVRGLFRDSDAMMADVNTLLDNPEVRQAIMEMGDCAQQYNDVALVVISRRELGLANTSSPLLLPDWFPVNAGANAVVKFYDLTWSVHISLREGVVAQTDLQRLLYELDKALLARIQGTLRADHRDVQGLWSRISRDGESDVARALESIDRTLHEVMNVGEFRPSTSRNPTMIGRLWYEANRSSPDALPQVAKALARALRVNEFARDSEMTTLIAVLNRPTNKIVDVRIQWSFHLIVTVRSACQLVTAAAHADDYPKFPDVLLRVTSLDLRRFLNDAIEILEIGDGAGAV